MDTRKKRKYWSEDEKELLRKLYEEDGLLAAEIAPILGRSKDAISIKIFRWGFKHSADQEFAGRSRIRLGENNPMWGKESPKKGKTKQNDESIAKGAKRQSEVKKKMFEQGLLPDISGDKNPMWGVPSWNKGLTKETDPRVAKGSEGLSERKKQEWLEKTEGERDRARQHCARIGIQNKSSTSIEVKVQNILSELGVEFEANFHCKYYACDIHILNTNLIIEVQGDYWHANPKFYNLDDINKTQRKNVSRDKRKLSYLTNRGYNVLYLWENDINKNLEWVELRIKDFISQENP